MSSHSGGQRWGQLRELSDIKGVCGHSGSADKVSEGLHGNYSSGVDLSWSFQQPDCGSAKAQEGIH